MKKLILPLLAAALLGSLPTRAHAAFTFTLSQVGNNVTLTGSGTLNITGLALQTTGNTTAQIASSIAYLTGGPTGFSNINAYGGLTGPAAFGSGGFSSASSGSGNLVGLYGTAQVFYVPTGYVSGSPLISTSTYNNATFATLGFTPGTYNYTLSNGDSISITGVPEPSTWVLLGVGAAGVGLTLRQRRRTSRA